MPKDFSTINLPTPLTEELKIWRMAFSGAYGRNITYAEMIRSMLDGLPETEPGVVHEMDHILSLHEDLAEQMSDYIKMQKEK